MSEAKNNIYIDETTGNAIFVRRNDDNSYSFYATKKNDDGSFYINSYEAINDIFDYLDKNNIDIKILSKKEASVGGKSGR